MKKRKHKIGLVLGGGGAKGFAHLGLLQAMKERDLEPDIIAGSSVGAMVGALYSDGYSAKEMLTMFKDSNLFDFASLKLNKISLLKTTNMQKSLTKLLRAKTFEELKLPLVVAASNITTGKAVYFSSGILMDKIIASASIPIVFNPVSIDEQYYVDGGLFDNFPAQTLRPECKTLVGMHLHPYSEQIKMKNIIHSFERVFHLVYQSHGWNKRDLCDIYVEPEPLKNYSVFDVRKGNSIYKIGYEESCKILDEYLEKKEKK